MNTKSHFSFYGCLLILTFVIFSAAKEVYVGSIVQRVNPFFLNFICFLIICLFFSVASIILNEKIIFIIKQNLHNIISLNISTMLCWISSFLSLVYIEPSIQQSINTAVGPMVTILWSHAIKAKKMYLSEIVTATLMLLTIFFMIIASTFGKSGIGYNSLQNTLLGVSFGIVSGTSIVGNTIFSKKLSNAGVPASLILSTRFYILVLVSFFAFLYTQAHHATHGLSNYIVEIALLAFFGIAFPLFVLQKGIEKVEPLTIALIIAFSPVFTYTFEVFDSRLFVSYYTLAGIFVMVILVLYNIKKGF